MQYQQWPEGVSSSCVLSLQMVVVSDDVHEYAVALKDTEEKIARCPAKVRSSVSALCQETLSLFYVTMCPRCVRRTSLFSSVPTYPNRGDEARSICLVF